MQVLQSRRASDAMKIVGLCSSYAEGNLLQTAVDSVRMLDHVAVFDGPVEGAPTVETWLPKQGNNLTVVQGEWASDAAKRTAMVEWVKGRRWLDGETWGLWLDGDELLLWGDQLRAWLDRAREAGDEENPVGGYPIPLVELDGSVVLCMGKVVRVDLILRYIVSSSYVELVNGRQLGIGNQEVWNPIDGPTYFSGEWRTVSKWNETTERHEEDQIQLPHWRARPPLQGEPHLLHRSILRSGRRLAERQSAAEERNFQGVDLPA